MKQIYLQSTNEGEPIGDKTTTDSDKYGCSYFTNKVQAIKFVLILVVAIMSVFSLHAISVDQDSVIINKLSLAHKLLLTNGYQQAYSIYNECALAGSATAINGVAIMKQRGWGTDKDEKGSIAWFEKAAAMGYVNAYYNLTLIYAKGMGVEQDFQKAAHYAKVLADMNQVWGQFQYGYYCYKGLGVEQSYTNAIANFLLAAKQDNANAYYFLGLCYRNGYGVERNDGEAQYYLQKATEKGHYYSKQELSEEVPENLAQPIRVKAQRVQSSKSAAIGASTQSSIVPNSFRKIMKQKVQGSLDGNYTGSVLVYDYSGRNVVRESKLDIQIERASGNHIVGKWVEADTIIANFEGLITDSTLQFIQTRYARTDYYNKKQAVSWIFKKAILEKTDIEGNAFLVGNIQLYSPTTKEPEKPMYITLQKVKSNLNLKSIDTFNNDDSRFIVYPNPIDRQMNLSFTLLKQEIVRVSVYGMNGILFINQNLGSLDAGKHSYVMELDIPAGQYIVRLEKPSGRLSAIVDKK